MLCDLLIIFLSYEIFLTIYVHMTIITLQVDNKHINAHRHTKQLHEQFIFLLGCLGIGADED